MTEFNTPQEGQSFNKNNGASNEAEPAKYAGTKNENYIVTGKELLDRKIIQLPFLVQNLVQQVGLVAVAGGSDTGKSTWLRQLACSIVKGDDHFLGFELHARHRSVIYVSTEDDELAISYLINKQEGDSDSSDFKNLRYIFDTSDLLEKLEEQLSKQPADAVVIDAWTDLYPGEMNATNKVRFFLDQFRNLAERYQCVFIFLHHTKKGSDYLPPSKENLLGSQGIEAKVRLVLEIRKDFRNPAFRHLCLLKGNYIPEDCKNESYVLHFDENMIYSNTGERVPFEQLAKPDPKQGNTQAEQRARELRSQGLSTRATADQLKREGIVMGKSKVSEITRDVSPDPSKREEPKRIGNIQWGNPDFEKECPPVHQPLGNPLDGQHDPDGLDDSDDLEE